MDPPQTVSRSPIKKNPPGKVSKHLIYLLLKIFLVFNEMNV